MLRFYAFHSRFSSTVEKTDGYMRLAHERSPKEQDPNQAWATAVISNNHPGGMFPTKEEQTTAASFPQMADISCLCSFQTYFSKFILIFKKKHFSYMVCQLQSILTWQYQNAQTSTFKSFAIWPGMSICSNQNEANKVRLGSWRWLKWSPYRGYRWPSIVQGFHMWQIKWEIKGQGCSSVEHVLNMHKALGSVLSTKANMYQPGFPVFIP